PALAWCGAFCYGLRSRCRWLRSTFCEPNAGVALIVNLTTRQLQAFLLVSKFKSFARASERMFMTPSGLSILMRELENQLGFRLFDRNTRQVVLTEYGNGLLPVVQQGMDNIQATIAAIARSAGEKSQRLNVGATP